MQLLPDLSEYLASELTHVIGSVAEPCRSHVKSMLADVSHSESAELKAGLALWLAGMKPELMVKRYTLLRQLILVVGEIIREEER